MTTAQDPQINGVMIPLGATEAAVLDKLRLRHTVVRSTYEQLEKWYVKPDTYTPKFPAQLRTDHGMLGSVTFSFGKVYEVTRVLVPERADGKDLPGEAQADGMIELLADLNGATCRISSSLESAPVPESTAGRNGASTRDTFVVFGCSAEHSIVVQRRKYVGWSTESPNVISSQEFWRVVR